MKLQWKSVSEEQERRNARLRDYRSLIGTVMLHLDHLVNEIQCEYFRRHL